MNKLSPEACQAIVNRANQQTVSSFSKLNAILATIPGVNVTVTTDDTGILPVLATLFDTSELVDGSLDLPRQTPAQSITLETHFFPDHFCISRSGTVDYSIGFRLGHKYAEVANGFYHDLLKHPA